MAARSRDKKPGAPLPLSGGRRPHLRVIVTNLAGRVQAVERRQRVLESRMERIDSVLLSLQLGQKHLGEKLDKLYALLVRRTAEAPK